MMWFNSQSNAFAMLPSAVVRPPKALCTLCSFSRKPTKWCRDHFKEFRKYFFACQSLMGCLLGPLLGSLMGVVNVSSWGNLGV